MLIILQRFDIITFSLIKAAIQLEFHSVIPYKKLQVKTIDGLSLQPPPQH